MYKKENSKTEKNNLKHFESMQYDSSIYDMKTTHLHYVTLVGFISMTMLISPILKKCGGSVGPGDIWG